MPTAVLGVTVAVSFDVMIQLRRMPRRSEVRVGTWPSVGDALAAQLLPVMSINVVKIGLSTSAGGAGLAQDVHRIGAVGHRPGARR